MYLVSPSKVLFKKKNKKNQVKNEKEMMQSARFLAPHVEHKYKGFMWAWTLQTVLSTHSI